MEYAENGSLWDNLLQKKLSQE